MSSYLGFYHPAVIPRTLPLFALIGRVDRNALLSVVQGGEAIGVLVILADAGRVGRCEGRLRGGLVQEELEASCKIGHHLPRGRHKTTGGPTQEEEQRHCSVE